MHPRRDDSTGEGADASLIAQHYADFNARRIDRAASQFHENAAQEHVAGQVEHGPEGYRRFAERWLDAFPDGTLTVKNVQCRDAGLYDVDLLATGTHTGVLAYGTWMFRPTNLKVRLQARQLLQIQGGLIHFSTLSFDVQDLVRQLAPVDTAKLARHLAHIQQLGEQIAVAPTPARQRELIERLGVELDAARHVVRPYFR